MGEILSPRVDAVSKLTPNPRPHNHVDGVARADGLTVDEALELVTWLKQAGYDGIEVIEETDQCCVLWDK